MLMTHQARINIKNFKNYSVPLVIFCITYTHSAFQFILRPIIANFKGKILNDAPIFKNTFMLNMQWVNILQEAI
ncbi:MAG: hypothetical protein CMF69_07410 [Magnetovibrio sp.]|nr:hypothetical protein [Magnetovibrio sp.]